MIGIVIVRDLFLYIEFCYYFRTCVKKYFIFEVDVFIGMYTTLKSELNK